MSRQKKITIFAGIILLAAGIIALSFYFGNQEKEERHRQGTAQRRLSIRKAPGWSGRALPVKKERSENED